MLQGHVPFSAMTISMCMQAPVSGSKKPAIDGQLIFLCGGDDTLYKECESAFDIMGKVQLPFTLPQLPYYRAPGEIETGRRAEIHVQCRNISDQHTRATGQSLQAHYYLGDVGTGARMKLVVNMIMGSMMCTYPHSCLLLYCRVLASRVIGQARRNLCCRVHIASSRPGMLHIVAAAAGAFSEGMSLASKSDLKQDVLLDVLSKGAMACPMFALKGPSMTKGEFPPAFPLKHQQKDMRLACELGCELHSQAWQSCVTCCFKYLRRRHAAQHALRCGDQLKHSRMALTSATKLVQGAAQAGAVGGTSCERRVQKGNRRGSWR